MAAHSSKEYPCLAGLLTVAPPLLAAGRPRGDDPADWLPPRGEPIGEHDPEHLALDLARRTETTLPVVPACVLIDDHPTLEHAARERKIESALVERPLALPRIPVEPHAKDVAASLFYVNDVGQA